MQEPINSFAHTEPEIKKLTVYELTKEQLNTKLLKGLDDIENGRTFSEKDVETDMRDYY